MSGPAPTAKARILASLKNEPGPTRAEVVKRERVALAVGVLLMTCSFFAFGGVRLGDRSPFAVATTAGVWCALAAVASAIALKRGASSLGAPTKVLWWATLLTAPALFASFAVVAALEGNSLAQPSLAGALGCFLATVTMAAAPFAAVVFARRGTDPVHPRAAAALMGAAAGAWAGVLIDMHCPSMNLGHVGVGHALPTLLAAGVGALVGDRTLGLRSK